MYLAQNKCFINAGYYCYYKYNSNSRTIDFPFKYLNLFFALFVNLSNMSK